MESVEPRVSVEAIRGGKPRELMYPVKLTGVGSAQLIRELPRTFGQRVAARVGTAVCASVLGLVLSGCGDGGNSDGDSGDSGGGAGENGPLAEFMGWDQEFAPGQESSEAERQQQHRVEEIVAECMRKQGFEYVPQRGNESGGTVLGGDEEAWALQQEDPEKFARQYGYGLSTLLYGEGTSGDEPADDPNEKIREQLSPAAQQEYDNALYGDLAVEGHEDGTIAIDPSESGDQGCQGAAWDEVYGAEVGSMGGDSAGGAVVQEPEQFRNLMDEMVALAERIDKEPRVTAAERAWSGCMAEAGYPGLTDVDDAETKVNERVLGSGEEEPEPGDTSTEVVPERDEAEIAELQEYERAVAYADFVCQRDHYQSVYRQVRDELETAFLENHRKELEAYRDSTNESAESQEGNG